VEPRRKALISGAFAEPSDGLEPSPPPYHGGFDQLLRDVGRRLLARFPCISLGLSGRCTLPLKDPEPPRKSPNPSPKPIPKVPAAETLVRLAQGVR
jgi:hypothetical protein